MELVASFEKFLNDEVNLNQSRIDKLNKKIETIDKFCTENDDLKGIYKELISQGSFGQKTIIKPVKNNEFDADVLLSINKVDSWEPSDYVNNIYGYFRSNKNYQDIVKKRTRCILLDYKGDFHIDVVPFIVQEGNNLIANRDENIFEETNPKAYTLWLFNKHKISSNQLIYVIRLFKYLRDVKTTFSVKSILLNTMLGNCINETEEKARFKNLPTAFVTIFDRLNNILQSNEHMPEVTNPTLEAEDFNRHWDEEKYQNFREKIKSYNEKVKFAYDETDKESSIKKWRDVFGDNFPTKIEEDAKASSFSVLTNKKRPWSN